MSDLLSSLVSSLTTSPVCPGNRNLLNGDEKIYLRIVFAAYWMDSPPSIEVFYFTKHQIKLTLKGIHDLEAMVLNLLVQHDTDANPLGVVYVGYSGVEMDIDDVALVDWRLIVGDHGHS